MRQIVLEFLENSFLFEEKYINNQYSSFSEEKILLELENYRNYITKNLDTLYQSIIIYSNFIRMYQSNLTLSLHKIKQMSFYLDQVIVKDKLFEFTTPKKDFNDEFARLIIDKDDSHLNLNELSSIILEIKSVRELIKYNYLVIFPISYFTETGSTLPLHFPKNYYNGILPSNIQQFYHNNAQVRSLKSLGEGKFQINPSLELSRYIDITFKHEPDMPINAYTLLEQEVLSYDEHSKKIEFKMSIPAKLPSQEAFDAWVTQSLNTTAIAHYNKTLLDVELSTKLKSYLCPSEFSFNLLNQTHKENSKNHQTNIIDLMLNFDLKFYDDVDMETLMKIKRDDGEEFYLFRKNLEIKLNELKNINNYSQIQNTIEDIKHEFNEVEIAKINKKIKDINKGILRDSIVLGAELAATTITGGWSLAAFFYSLASGYKSYQEYKTQISENPAYFLWRLKT